ncbi:MAG: 2-amino-4-hydroxy-6-hydroxymethyldihydropteridine diphosphokinase [Gammaproteobacteria bacterium]|nr:2-amino-4-hydroxy-6-hydroxymethyldihydropteridine diphosphokinase [Gammaproteobacteria bacterium]
MSSRNNIINGTITDLPSDTGIPLVLVGLGSNLGASSTTLHRAFIALQALSDFPVIVSSLWRTAPVDCPPGSPDFVNAVAALLPRFHGKDVLAFARGVLGQLHGIEEEFGRTRGDIQNTARTLDLDLLTCGFLQVVASDLILPHPRLHQRAFVLAPLAEIAPAHILPGQSLSVENLLAALKIGVQSNDKIQRINIADTCVTL